MLAVRVQGELYWQGYAIALRQHAQRGGEHVLREFKDAVLVHLRQSVIQKKRWHAHSRFNAFGVGRHTPWCFGLRIHIVRLNHTQEDNASENNCPQVVFLVDGV